MEADCGLVRRKPCGQRQHMNTGPIDRKMGVLGPPESFSKTHQTKAGPGDFYLEVSYLGKEGEEANETRLDPQAELYVSTQSLKATPRGNQHSPPCSRALQDPSPSPDRISFCHVQLMCVASSRGGRSRAATVSVIPWTVLPVLPDSPALLVTNTLVTAKGPSPQGYTEGCPHAVANLLPYLPSHRSPGGQDCCILACRRVFVCPSINATSG